MLIRKTLPEDVDTILNIFDTARQFMHATGNPTQWNANYPALEDLEPDIQNGNSYVCVKMIRSLPLLHLSSETSRTINSLKMEAGVPRLHTEPFTALHLTEQPKGLHGLALIFARHKSHICV